MPYIVKEDVSLDPMVIGLLGPSTIMSRAHGFAELIEEFLFCGAGGSLGVTLVSFLVSIGRWVRTIFSGVLVPVIPLLQNHLNLKKEPANRCVVESENRNDEAIKHFIIDLSRT